jgi:Glycosyl hydrolase family 48
MPMSRRKFTATLGGAVAALVAGPGAASAATKDAAMKDALAKDTAANKPEAAAADPYADAFVTQYNKIKDPANGYFSPQGVPYHAVETLIVEAPDHGHETTSEAFSYWMWLEAAYGRITGDWAPFNAAWEAAERYIIPTQTDQPTNGGYNPSSPATYAPEWPDPSRYPSALDTSVAVGQDPIAGELQSAYGSPNIYGMHWLMDVDNVYGYGNTAGTGAENGPSASGPCYINSYQRGSQESVWETIPQPCTDQFRYGGPNGYLDLFIGDQSYAQQWKYTNAPDADARAIQATYWAVQWATAQGNAGAISASAQRAAKMGDYLRYAMFDKYFKRVGDCVGAGSCPAGDGRSSQHYLLSWYFAWGGGLAGANWAWRIGDGASHHGYQNPMAAYALTNVSTLRPRGASAATDWNTSLQRQLEFLQWLQSAEGAIAGGATNSWDGQYGTPPAGTPTFYGMAYDWQPVYHDPPSNNWFGMQAWGMERWAEYYYVTGNATVKAVLDKWVAWVVPEITVSGADFRIPSTLEWSGAPGGDWQSGTTSVDNSGLHVSIVEYGTDLGVASALVKTLLYYAAKAGDTATADVARQLLDALVAHADSIGVGVEETRADYNRFDDPVFVPNGWSGTMPNGDPIQSGATFISIRSWYRDDPQWPKVQAYLDGGAAPTFTYHRFWAQAGIAIALAVQAELFPSGETTGETTGETN